MQDGKQDMWCANIRRRPVDLSHLGALPEGDPAHGHLISLLRNAQAALTSWDVDGSSAFNLPPTAFGDDSSGRTLSLFKEPTFDELQSLATDPMTGELKMLSRNQKAALRATGKFDVPSALFPGQMHSWELNAFLIVGTQSICEGLLSRLAYSIEQILVELPDLLTASGPHSRGFARSRLSFRI